MNSIAELVNILKTWASAKEAYHRGEKCPFLLSCRFSDAPASAEVSGLNVGADLEAFWLISDTADLFKDEKYGQWGLKILPPDEVVEFTSKERAQSPEDFHDGDIVVGQFYGDSDLLIIDASKAEQGEFPVLIKLPIDERSEWPRVAESFGEFLERYLVSEGDKFWEI